MSQIHPPGRKSITLPATYALLSATKKTLAKITNMIYTDDQEDNMESSHIVNNSKLRHRVWERGYSRVDWHTFKFYVWPGVADMLDVLIELCIDAEMLDQGSRPSGIEAIEKATGYTWQELTESDQ